MIKFKMPSAKENAKQNQENSVEIQTATNRLVLWVKRDLGVPEKLREIHKDGSDDFLKRVYEFNKQNIKNSERFLYKFYKMRCNGGVSEIFHNRNAESEEILKSCQSVYLFTLPQSTKRGHRILFMKLAPNMSLEDFDPKALFKRFFMISDIRFKEDVDCKKELFILDLDGFTRQHAVKLFSGGYINKFVKCLTEIYPRKIHAVHLIRAKTWHKSTLNVWLKMSDISKKMASRIKTHSMDESEMEGLGVQLQCLSGKIQDLNDVWTKKLISYSSWFESQDAIYMSTTPKTLKFASVKSKPSDDNDLKIASHHSEIYTFESMEGSFKKIET